MPQPRGQRVQHDRVPRWAWLPPAAHDGATKSPCLRPDCGGDRFGVAPVGNGVAPPCHSQYRDREVEGRFAGGNQGIDIHREQVEATRRGVLGGERLTANAIRSHHFDLCRIGEGEQSL